MQWLIASERSRELPPANLVTEFDYTAAQVSRLCISSRFQLLEAEDSSTNVPRRGQSGS